MMKQAITFGKTTSKDGLHHSFMWTDAQGKRHCKRVTGTLGDVEIAKAQLLLGIGQGEQAASGFTWDAYWDECVVPTLDALEAKTRAEYVRLWNRELSPRIGSEIIASLTWRYAESTLNSIEAASVVRSSYRLWRKVANMAVRDGLLDRNPIDCRLKLKKHVKREKELLEAADVAPWMEALRGCKHEAVLLCELGGGLRHEEACALLWTDIEPLIANGKVYASVTVSKALVTVPKLGKQLKGTKTQGSNRTVIIGEPFASRLLELREGYGPLSPAYPVGEKEGYAVSDYTSPTTISRNYNTWLERRGHKHITPAAMRSTYATLHAEAGSLDSLVSLSMGHSDGTTRGTHYQKSTVNGLCSIADNLASWLHQVMQIDAEMPENGPKMMQNCIILSVA